MIEDVFLKGALEGGLAFFVALVVVYWNRKDTTGWVQSVSDMRKECLACRHEERADKAMMFTIIQENTKALTELRDAVRASGGGLNDTKK